MLIARPLSAIGGLLVLVLLSRLLPSAAYGMYFAVWAVIEILILASNIGLLHAAYRYISATEWDDGNFHIQGPLWQLVFWRVISLVTVGSVLIVLPTISDLPLITIPIPTALVTCIALIIFGEGLARFVEALFDSMLCQGRSQLTLVSRTLIKLIGLSYFAITDSISLEKVVLLELAAATTGVTAGLLMLITLHRKSAAKSTQHPPETTGIGRMTRFALPGYAAQLLGISYGPDSLKLALGSVAGATAIAVFGFAYSIAAVAQRYMPINILAGVFRPIFVAASRKPDSDQLLSDLLSASIKINWVFILPGFCFLFFGGNPMLSHLSDGNYSNAGTVATYLIIGLLAVAVHINLSMFCLAKENGWPPLIATAVSMIGLPLGFALAQKFGAIGIAVAFGASELIWASTCLLLLNKAWKQRVRLDWAGLVKLILLTAGVTAIWMVLTTFMSMHWLAPATLAPLTLLLLVFPFGIFTAQEKAWLVSVLPLNKLPFRRCANA